MIWESYCRKYIRGIAFLVTPLLGSEKAKWAEQAHFSNSHFRKNGSDILQQLEKKWTNLVDLCDEFERLLHARMKDEDTKIHVAFFYET
ncbi:hypothetical protein K432DRAFT_381892 [Lepidopterella palustris CBS 459.81]|uniref:Uncharacterized protein n=1 Tax=Lepidopterella palustris CBS 459.81 TaxID=1314670 RepID=A0A8E2EC26_9PEZI|nr:hypothetical protein K432DRAFT_381892 [Lepidopterella palustris CBS 459.81]